MPTVSTSFRLEESVRQRLADHARTLGVTTTALLEQLIVEGLVAAEFPGIIYRGPFGERRAGLAAGPDVWEIVARIQELPGTEEERIAILTEESPLHAHQIRLALDFAAHHPDEVRERIERNERALHAAMQAAEERQAFLA